MKIFTFWNCLNYILFADELAKSTATSNLKISYNLHSLSHVKKCSKEHILTEWNNNWLNSSKGLLTKETFFPNVELRLRSLFQPDFILTQFATGHGKFGSYFQRFKVPRENGYLCICGEQQTVEHLLFHCPAFEKRRYVLKGHLDCCKISFTKPLSCIFQKTCCSRQFSNFISHVHNSL